MYGVILATFGQSTSDLLDTIRILVDEDKIKGVSL